MIPVCHSCGSLALQQCALSGSRCAPTSQSSMARMMRYISLMGAAGRSQGPAASKERLRHVARHSRCNICEALRAHRWCATTGAILEACVPLDTTSSLQCARRPWIPPRQRARLWKTRSAPPTGGCPTQQTLRALPPAHRPASVPLHSSRAAPQPYSGSRTHAAAQGPAAACRLDTSLGLRHPARDRPCMTR